MPNIQILSLLVLVSSAVVLGAKIRIYGGRASEEGQYPFYVSVRIFNAHFCGGSIIDPQWVLTAGHCCTKFTNYRALLNVVAGIHNAHKRGYIYTISKIIVHPDFHANQTKVINDICLLKLRKPIKKQTKTVQTIQLERKFDDTRRDVQIMGFGEIYQNGPTSSTLDWIPMKTIPHDVCYKIWRKRTNQTVEKSDICALSDTQKGTCHGDSGGGLIHYNTENLPPILIGIASWGKPCAHGLPDVFTRVSSFIDWIELYVKKS